MADEFALASDVNNFWVMFGAVLVFFMQTGFAMLEVGSVQKKNQKNILIKNVFDATLGAIIFWLYGYGIAFGTDTEGGDNDGGLFVGRTQYGLKGMQDYSFWLYQWAFSATAATIVSGAVAERITFEAYFVYVTVLCSLIYPFVVHWGWAAGFMSAWRSNNKDDLFLGCGVVDFAGSGVVHMVGGVAALVAIYFLGARKGRFDGGEFILPDYGPIFQNLGTLILFTGWFGFNGVSTLAITGLGHVASKTMATTAIAASSGCLTNVLMGYFIEGFVDPGLANNGVLAGLVGITAGCSTVNMEGAFVIGIISAWVYYGFSRLLRKLELDDVVDASPVHFAAGVWGVLAAGLFTTKQNYSQAYFEKYDDGTDRAEHCQGAFYGGGGHQFGANFVFVLLVIGWVGGLSILLFAGIKYTIGIRISAEDEDLGLDASHHQEHKATPVPTNDSVNTTDIELSNSAKP